MGLGKPAEGWNIVYRLAHLLGTVPVCLEYLFSIHLAT